jgi:hypothetical protein
MMKKFAIISIFIFCLALAVGTAYSQQAEKTVNGVLTDATDTGPVAQVTQSPVVVPEGKYVVNGMVSDNPAPPSYAATETSSTPTIIEDGMLVGEEPQAQPPFPDIGPSLPGERDRLPVQPDLCVPHSLIILNFDERTQPGLFANALALRYDYRSNWAVFDGPALKDGGAVLDQSGGFGVSGYSPPNFLAFNANSTLSDGGKPRQPEQVYFLGKASYVELLAGSNSGAGNDVTIEAFNEHGVSLGSTSTILDPVLKKLFISAKNIYRLEIRTVAAVFVVDNLAYIPEAYPLLVDFDDVSAPCGFISTTALTDRYWMHGVTFSGPALKDGGAILNECGGFGVNGHSAPNFLAFNSNSSLSDGGIPRQPESILFQFPVSFVQLYVGSSFNVGTIVTAEAFDVNGASLGTTSLPLEARMRPMTIMARNISKIVLSTTDPVFVVDDLIFVEQSATYVDFDESVQPGLFMYTTALRNNYQSCRLLFNGPALKDGGAILDQSSEFGVSGFTSRNFLAFNSFASLSDGGIPRAPEEISFLHPVDSIQFYVGSETNAGTSITLDVYDQDDILVGTRTVVLQPKLQLLGFHYPRITRAVISTAASLFVVDGLNFHYSPIIYLPLLTKGQ